MTETEPLGWTSSRPTEACSCGTPPVQIETTQRADGSYRSRVTVDGEFYAEVTNPDREDCIAEAVHYGTQAVDDYWSPWKVPNAEARKEIRDILKSRLEGGD